MRIAISIVTVALAIGMLAWWLCFAPSRAALAPPALLKQWHEQVYGLDEGEVLRFVPPPFPAGRMAMIRPTIAAQARALGLNGQMVYDTSPRQLGLRFQFTASGTVGSALRWCTRTSGYDMNNPNADPASFGYLQADGDWVVRTDAPVERRVAVLESILHSVTGRKLLIEARPIERAVIVVSGTWQFHSIDDQAKYHAGAIHLYTRTLDPPRNIVLTSGSLKEVLSWLSVATRLTVLDEAVGAPQPINWYNHRSVAPGTMNEFELNQLLENLAKQTSLKFKMTRREIAVWTVREESAGQ